MKVIPILIAYSGNGNISNNWDLSTKRATAIVGILTENHKILKENLTAAGRGEFSPIATNSTSEGRSKNRRIEVILTPKLDEISKLLNELLIVFLKPTMKYTHLPNTDIKVSKICLGSMTWGEQNTEAEGHAQLDYALEKGINFIDTAEMYSVPGNPKTQGSTESIIGTWLAKNNNRDQVVLASKITGPLRFFEHIRKNLNFSKEALNDALTKSLKRMQTDYIDLYQLHWPERGVNVFGVRDYTHNEKWEDNIAKVLESLESFVKQGKIRQIGLSNETPWGVMRYCEEAKKGAPKMITVQNAYNLLNRRDEIGLSEVLLREDVGYLAYSPLAFGVLAGKYLNNNQA